MGMMMDRVDIAALQAAVDWIAERTLHLVQRGELPEKKIRFDYETAIADDRSILMISAARRGIPVEPLYVQYLELRGGDEDDDDSYYTTTLSLTLRSGFVRLSRNNVYFEVTKEKAPRCHEALETLHRTLLEADGGPVVVRAMVAVLDDAVPTA